MEIKHASVALAKKVTSSAPKKRTTRIAIEKTANRKTGPVSITRASKITCPRSCPLLGVACYAETGAPGVHGRRITRDGGNDIIAFARIEAAAIRSLTGKRPLRLHDDGDCPNAESARIVTAAAEEYSARLGQIAWTYTHTNDVPRDAWGKVSVLRSVHSIEGARKAMADGYAAALLVDKFHSDTAYPIAPDMVGIPCPYSTKKIQCADCGLCLHADKLLASRRVILFEPHGARMKKVAAASGAAWLGASAE